MRVYINRIIYALLALLFTFGIIFFIAINALRNGYTLINIGIDADVENWLIIILSTIAIIRIVVEIIRIEIRN